MYSVANKVTFVPNCLAEFVKGGKLRRGPIISERPNEHDLCKYQLDAQFFCFVFVYSNSLHVSTNQVLIIRRINCINTTSGICHCM